MEGYKKYIFIGNLVLFLGFLNWKIVEKEQTINKGELVLMELRPRDPRSLMQGDYMVLRYAIANEFRKNEHPNRGYCIVSRDEKNVAQFKRFQANNTNVAKDEVALKYYSSDYRLKIGAESFFFEEGQAKAYNAARYGGLRVDGSGAAVLTGVYDENAKLLLNNYELVQ